MPLLVPLAQLVPTHQLQDLQAVLHVQLELMGHSLVRQVARIVLEAPTQQQDHPIVLIVMQVIMLQVDLHHVQNAHQVLTHQVVLLHALLVLLVLIHLDMVLVLALHVLLDITLKLVHHHVVLVL